ncbi:MAG: Holliday junction branch migration protein RuvA [Melioribacteraceae bacterium]|nr:Holliday junction branch migration protein RuvA [Melioribacteraceae bacterium]MCF8264172.1 Holliday junction branch migration protein RuvA [Melioribacteraceae bacterium]MCF8430514.1 Holliday junction branch migration protein RuvA [Melioribacteraceae bacterium]
MIASLMGKIISKEPTVVLIDVNGVGYLVHISINTFEKLPPEKSEVFLHTYLHVKEDALDLYGFLTQSEKSMFTLLISVSGVGCKSAQGILSGIQINDLKDAITGGNLSRIVAIPGIGKKTGERLILELRDKIRNIAGTDNESPAGSQIKNDAVNALVTLGYNQRVAEKFVQAVLMDDPQTPLELLIKQALSRLNK